MDRQVPVYYHWEKAAQKLIQHLWKFEGAHIFHFPVDWKTWHLDDYPTIVKNPMDFTTIKQKLQDRKYEHMNQFIDDVQLVFSNCILYNGEHNDYGVIAIKVKQEFDRQYEALNMDYYVM